MNEAPAPHIRLGFRFHRGDALRLETLAELARSGQIGDRHVAKFAKAAEAARSGEPLIVYVRDPDEGRQVAAWYATFGVLEPTLDDIFATGI